MKRRNNLKECQQSTCYWRSPIQLDNKFLATVWWFYQFLACQHWQGSELFVCFPCHATHFNYYYSYLCHYIFVCYRGHVEVGIDAYRAGRVPQGHDYAEMYNKSPVAHIDNIVTPAMIMLGRDDRRVPPSQGIEFHKALLAKGVESRWA